MFVSFNYFIRKINYGEKFKKILNVSNKYCFGIYLWAEPLNYLILYFAYTYFGIEIFASEIGSLIIYLLRILVTPIIAIVIVNLLKNLKFKYIY